jgi:hypothetical protein
MKLSTEYSFRTPNQLLLHVLAPPRPTIDREICLSYTPWIDGRVDCSSLKASVYRIIDYLADVVVPTLSNGLKLLNSFPLDHEQLMNHGTRYCIRLG